MPKHKQIETFYDSGAVKEKKILLKGKLDGEYVSFFENGQPMVQVKFVNGLKQGEAVSYYRNGSLRGKSCLCRRQAHRSICLLL